MKYFHKLFNCKETSYIFKWGMEPADAEYMGCCCHVRWVEISSRTLKLYFTVLAREKLSPCSRLYVLGWITLQSSPLTNISKLPRWEESNFAWSFSKASHYEECPVFRRRTRKWTVWLHHCFMWQTGIEQVGALTFVGISWNRNQQIGPVDRRLLSWKHYVS